MKFSIVPNKIGLEAIQLVKLTESSRVRLVSMKRKANYLLMERGISSERRRFLRILI